MVKSIKEEIKRNRTTKCKRLYKGNHIKWITCNHDMARSWAEDGGDGLQIWMAAGNILKRQSQIADEGRSSRFGVGHGSNNSSE
jgi:hypothetical protein